MDSEGKKAFLHTPGPWVVEDIFEDGGFDICLGYPLPGAGNPIPFASVNGVDEFGDCPKTRKEAKANARLIAAAPDLLEIARIVVKSRESLEKLTYEEAKNAYDNARRIVDSLTQETE